MNDLNLLSSTTHVETPYVKVTIGDYTFGVFDESIERGGVYRGKSKFSYTEGAIKETKIKFPNYIKSLDITKINGVVNKYTLRMEYTIRETDDPNFFEKVFSSVSKTRKIIFSYGDLMLPSYCYKDEEAIITDVKSSFSVASSRISYTVYAISSSVKLTTGANNFPERRNTQPSEVIRDLLKDESFGLLEVFYGMRNGTSLNGVELIPSNDEPKNLLMKTNISVLDYLKYLVNEMTPKFDGSLIKNNLYTIIISDDISGELQGPYFQIKQVETRTEKSDAYTIDIGVLNKDIVLDFSVDNDESYSIYYDFQNSLTTETYVTRYNNRGEKEEVYAPVISSGNDLFETTEADKSWWTKVTSYPIKASITIKGLLRPAILMTHVRLNVIFYGRKHISSGLYMVTKQVDTISESGFKTKLDLVRIGGDDMNFIDSGLEPSSVKSSTKIGGDKYSNPFSSQLHTKD